MKRPQDPTKKPATAGRKQVREETAPRVNVPRQSKRPVERSNQHRSRRSARKAA
jgi:hypothetical protein